MKFSSIFFNKKNKSAQIMLLTLLVLMIIAIAVIGILNLVIRDTNQISNSQGYQEALQASESITQRAVELYGNNPSLTSIGDLTGSTGEIDSTLSDLLDNCILEVENQQERAYECRRTSDENLASVLTVADKKEINDFELEINHPLTINLEGYLPSEGILLNWDSNLVAIELSLIYLDGSGTISVAEAFWDEGSLRVSDNPSSIQNEISLVANTFHDSDKSFQISNFSLQNLTNLISLTITPRSKDTTTNEIELNLSPTDYTIFPFQIREFRTTSFNPNNGSAPTVSTFTQLPIAPQLDSIFNYSLLTSDSVGIL